MKHLYFSLFALIALTNGTRAQGPDHVQGDILAMLAPGASPETVVQQLSDLNGRPTGLQVTKELSSMMRTWLFHYSATDIAQQEMLSAFHRLPAVQIAQNNHIVSYRAIPNDTQYGQQWQHQNIMSEDAWDITTGGLTATGDTIVVCVLENSDLPHPDLIGNAWFNHGEIPNNSIDDDGNGYVDDHRGWNTQGNDNVYGGSHGTQVCGMIGAKGDNAQGVAGANWNVKIMVVEFGGVQEAEVIAAYTYPWTMRKLYNQTMGGTLQQGAFVVSTNASWGIDGGQPANAPLWCAIYDSLGTEGILSCGATANNAVDVDQVGDLPTACPSDFMISVTATNTADNRTFSAYGATTIDVGAPGDNVFTTSIGGGYGSTSGTSFASPLTAGVIGLLYSAPCSSLMDLVHADPAAGALYIRQALFNGVDVVGNLPGNTVTGGRINAFNSLQEILNNCGACPAPFSVSASPVSATDALVNWNATGTGPFNLQYRPLGTSTWTTQNNLINTSFMASGLQPCTDYEFQVEAECDTTTSGFSQSAFLIIVPEPTPTIALNNDDTFCQGDSVMLTASASTNILWSTGDTTQSITVAQSGQYSVTVNGACSTAQSDPVSITALDPMLPVGSDVTLPGAGVATLNAAGDSIQWYTDQTGGTSIGSGSPWDTPFVSATTDFWCSNTELFGGALSMGGFAANTTSGQYHTNATNYQLFTATAPFTIRSVKVYASGAGDRPIGLVNTDNNTTIAQGTFTIPDGESRVQLDFEVPGPGNYGLRIMNGNPQLWRDGLGSNPPYPFALGTFGTIIGSTAGNSTGYYYFFYDWEVQAEAWYCESERIPVNVSLPTGLSETSGGITVQVLPNPADQQLVLSISGLSAYETLRVAVLDPSGRMVSESAVRDGNTTLNTAAFANGLYTYRITTNEELLYRGRFVVAH